MSRTVLRNYLKERNRFEAIFNGRELPFPRTPEECKPIFEHLSGELSPENLCCDGELAPSLVRKKAARLHKCWAALEAIYGSRVTEDDVYRWWHDRQKQVDRREDGTPVFEF